MDSSTGNVQKWGINLKAKLLCNLQQPLDCWSLLWISNAPQISCDSFDFLKDSSSSFLSNSSEENKSIWFRCQNSLLALQKLFALLLQPLDFLAPGKGLLESLQCRADLEV